MLKSLSSRLFRQSSSKYRKAKVKISHLQWRRKLKPPMVSKRASRGSFQIILSFHSPRLQGCTKGVSTQNSMQIARCKIRCMFKCKVDIRAGISHPTSTSSCRSSIQHTSNSSCHHLVKSSSTQRLTSSLSSTSCRHRS